jgi:exosortase
LTSARPSEAARPARRLAALWPLLASVVGAIAYQPLLASAVQRPSAHAFETWLFRPSQLPSIFALGVAAWLAWQRRARLAALPPSRHAVATALFATASAALFVWAVLTRSVELLLPSLAANVLALGAATRGLAGARVLGLSALVLLLGVPIPAPLRNEIVWFLQRATATGAEHALATLGFAIAREGVILRHGEHSFHVIDGCSGLQGIATLTLVSLVIGELHALRARGRVLLVAIAPALGYALNVVRIAYITASPNPEAYAGLNGDHTPQGLALLAVGTAALYGLGLSGPGLHGPGRRLPAAALGAAPTPTAAPRAPWPLASAWLATLAVLAFALPPFAPRSQRAGPSAVAVPDSRAGWTSESLQGDPYFLGVLLPGQMIHRHYVRAADEGPNVVELFVAREDPSVALDTSNLFSSKLDWPGPEWQLQAREPARIWDLGRDATFAIAWRPSGPERAVVYTWRARDEGLWRESLRAMLALEASPFRRARERAVVQLVTYTPFDEPLTLARAKRRLEGFIRVFRDELSAL